MEFVKVIVSPFWQKLSLNPLVLTKFVNETLDCIVFLNDLKSMAQEEKLSLKSFFSLCYLNGDIDGVFPPEIC